MNRIIYVKSKDAFGGYPASWVLLNYSEGRFYLGGAYAVVVSDAKQAVKAKLEAEKQFGEKLFHYSKKLKVWEK